MHRKDTCQFFSFFCYICKTAVCLDPEISPPWQRDVTIFPLYCYCVVTQLFILLHCIFQREKQERQQQQRTVKSKLREKRQISARARRYYDEYEVRMRARMLKRRTREEQVRKIKIFRFSLDEIKLKVDLEVILRILFFSDLQEVVR